MKIPLYGTTVNGKPVFDNPAYAQSCFSEYEGKRFLITLEPESKTPTLKQHAYYRGVVVEYIYMYLRGEGHEIDRGKVHALLAGKFLQDVLIGRGGEILGGYVKSTTDLRETKEDRQFSQFIEDCRQWAAEILHIDIPDPTKEYGRRNIL